MESSGIGIIPAVLTGMGVVAAVLLGVWGIVARYDSRVRDRMDAQGKEQRAVRASPGANGQAGRAPGRAPGSDHRKAGRVRPATTTHPRQGAQRAAGHRRQPNHRRPRAAEDRSSKAQEAGRASNHEIAFAIVLSVTPNSTANRMVAPTLGRSSAACPERTTGTREAAPSPEGPPELEVQWNA